MLARKPTEPGIPDRPLNIETVFHEVSYLVKTVTQLSTVQSSVEHIYDKRLLDVERKLDTLTETFITLVRRLNVIIELHEKELKL